MDNTGTYYLLEGIALAFFSVMAVQNLWHRGERLRMLLGWILLYWAAQHAVSVAFTSNFLSLERDWSPVINAIDMTAEPTCLFILMELCMPGWVTWRRVVINELPFVALAAMFIATGSMTWYWVLTAFFVAYGTATFIATLVLIPRYNRTLRDHYSYDENVNLRWLYGVLVTFFVMMLVYALCSGADTVVGDCIYLAGIVACWSIICFFISRQESVIEEVKSMGVRETEVDAELEPSPIEKGPIDLEQPLQKLFIEPQQYLRHDLKLGQVAAMIGTNRTYLSRYINDTLGTTFYDYVNSLRLNHATQMIANSDAPIQVIADMAGFSSYSTFRRAFIARYGVAPQEYRAKHQNNNSKTQ